MSSNPDSTKGAGETIPAQKNEEIPSTAETNVVPPFINNWAPLPSSASATNSIGLNSSLNLNMNLVNFYGSGSGSVISGPPLLGGVMMSTNNSNNGGNTANIRSDYYSFPVSGNNNNQTIGSSAMTSAGTSAGMNIPSPADGLQRSHSNNFNGFAYNQNPPFNSNSGSMNSLNTSTLGQPGGMSGSHIDFMNINNSPPLLSSASSTSPGLFLSNMSNKGENMNMMNHSNLFTNIHGILPNSSGSYSNLINLNGAGNNEGVAVPQNNVGAKRPATSTLNPATAAAVVAANKKAKANAARARAASDVGGLAPGPAVASTAPGGPAGLLPGNPAGQSDGTAGVSSTMPVSHAMAPPTTQVAPNVAATTSTGPAPTSSIPAAATTAGAAVRAGGPLLSSTQQQQQQQQQQQSNAYFAASGPATLQPGQQDGRQLTGAAGYYSGTQTVSSQQATQQGNHSNYAQHPHQQHQQHPASYSANNQSSIPSGGAGFYGASSTGAGYGHPQTQQQLGLSQVPNPHQPMQHSMQAPSQQQGGMQQAALQQQQQGGMQAGGPTQGGMQHGAVHQHPQGTMQHGAQHQQSGNMQHGQHGQQIHLQNPTGMYVPGNPSSQVSPRSMGYIPQAANSSNASGEGMVAYQTSSYPNNSANSTYSMQMQSGYHPAHPNSGNQGNYSQVQYHHANQGHMQLAQGHQNQAPIYTPGVIPPNKMGMAAVPAKQARVRAAKPPKAAKKAPAAGVIGNAPGAVQQLDGTETSSSVGGQDVPPNDGPPVPPVKPLTYKEKRAMSSKKAMAAAAAAEAQRNGELPPSMRADGEAKRKDSKKDKDSNTAEGERHEKEKAEKEESLTALLKRREPIASRLEDIEDSKFLGRKAPIAPTPDILPVPPAGAMIKAEVFSSHGAGLGSTASCTGSRPKTHWDYLLEEVQWMALDFRQELRWKLGAAKHTAEACASRSSQCMVPRKLADVGPVESSVGRCGAATNPLGLAVRRSASDGQAARTVAQTLSRSVQSYWTALEEKVVSSSRNGANLRDFLNRVSKEDCTTVDIFDISDDENETQGTTPTLPAVALSKMIDKILSVPTLIAAAQQEVVKVEANTPASEKARTSHRKTRSPSTTREEPAAVTPVATADPSVVSLQAHQHAAVAHIEALNKLSFGAVVCGKPYIGKTVACCAIMHQWLSAAQCAADTVLLVAPRTSAARWMAELRSATFLGEFEFWNEFPSQPMALKVEKADNGTVHGKVLFVAEDVLDKYLQSSAFQSLTVKAEAIDNESVAHFGSICGAVVDLRRVRCSTQDQADHTPTFLARLTVHLPATIMRRCLVREDAHQLDNILETLCFLCPGTAAADWRAKFPTEAVSSKKSGTNVSDAHLDQINRNTVSQLLANLTVFVKLPGNADSVVAAQTRMETIAAEMDPTQARSYNLLMTHILSHSAARSGENTAQLAHALILLRKVCFHASLICHTGHYLGPRPVVATSISNAKYATNASPITVDGGYYAGGLVNPALRPATHPSSGSELYWAPSADRPASQWRPTGPTLHAAPTNSSAGDYLQQMPTGFPSAPLAEVSFAQGPIAVSSSKFREVPTQEGLELGSCKLVCLRRLVRRFAGLKVAVVIETSEECVLVQQLLSLLNVKFDTAFHCDHQDDGEGSTDAEGHDCSPFRGVSKAQRWMDAQNSVQTFNSPQNNSSFLLCSKHVFQSPNIPPHQADAVVILSEDWVSTTDVKDCFRIRLLSAGPTGPPLTVVRVVAAASIEERMVRKGASFLQLQGTPLVQLRAGFHAHFPQTNGDMSKDSQHGSDGPDESTLLCKAPTLVLPSIPRPVSGGNNSLTSPAQDTEHCIAKDAPITAAAVVPPKSRESEEGGRGKGKGFIMVGKQGATTLVKEQDAAQGMVLSRARTSSGDPLKHPDTLAWIRRLCHNMRTAEAEFKRRNCSINFSQAQDVVAHSVKSPLRLLNTVTNEECSVDAAASSTTTHSAWSAAIMEINYVLGRAVLGSSLAEQASNKQGRCHTRVLKALESRWLRSVQRLQTSAQQEDDDKVAVVTPDSARSLSDWEVRRLEASGLGMNAAECMLSALVLPYRASALMPQEPNALNKVKSEQDAAAPSAWPQSFFVFRDVLAETRRQGIALEATLHVNPLQSACRNDTITASDYRRSRLSEDSICIKYIVDGAKGSAGTSRSSKSRRSRPSASRRKDQTGATAEGSAGGADGAATTVEDGNAENTAGNFQQAGQEKDFEVGFLSDLDPMDSPQRATPQVANNSARYATAPAAALAVNSPNKSQKAYPQQSPGAIGPSAAAAAVPSPSAAPAPVIHSVPMGRPVHVQESNYDSWHPTEDDIIICTQNAFSDPHFKRTENWLNKAQEQANNSRKRARTATEARLRYTWLCTTGRTQQRLQDPQVIAQIEHLKSFLSARQANAANGASVVAGAQGGSNVSSPALVRPQDSSPAPMPNINS